jgi:hypothetical protein
MILFWPKHCLAETGLELGHTRIADRSMKVIYDGFGDNPSGLGAGGRPDCLPRDAGC